MKTLGRFGPPLALMGLIWLGSAQPDLSSGLGAIDFAGRKLVHATEFGLLWWLWHRALGWERPGAAAVIALGWAGIDEYHQTFVDGRHGTPVDAAIDAFGVLVAWVLDGRLRRRRSEPAALGGHEDGLGAVDGAELPVDVVEVGADRARRE